MIDASPTIILCFDWIAESRCRSLTPRNDSETGDIFVFNSDYEFEIDKVIFGASKHSHYGATMANYGGFPLILGGINNNNLELLNTIENPPRWIEYEETTYPFSRT